MTPCEVAMRSSVPFVLPSRCFVVAGCQLPVQHRCIAVAVLAICTFSTMIRPITAAEVDDVLGALETWFSTNSTIEFDCVGEESFEGGFFVASPSITSTTTVHCKRSESLWVIDRFERFIKVVNGQAVSYQSRKQYVSTDELRLQIQFGQSGEIDGVLGAISKDDTNLRRYDTHLRDSGLAFGRLRCNGEPSLSDVLRSSSPVTVKADERGSAGATILEAHGKYGRHRVWVDGDGCPRRIVVEKEASDILGKATVGEIGSREVGGLFPAEYRRRQTTTVDPIKYDYGDGAPLLKMFGIVDEIEFDKGSRVRISTQVTYSNVVRPNAIPASQFKPTVPIPNDTAIAVLGSPGIQYVWKDGSIVARVDENAVRRRAEMKFNRGFRSPWYLAGVLGLFAVVAALLAFRTFRSAGP